MKDSKRLVEKCFRLLPPIQYNCPNLIRKGGEDRAKMIKAILAVKDYKGVLGTYSVTPNGDGLHEVSVVPLKFP